MSTRLESNSNDYDSNEISRASSAVGIVGGGGGGSKPMNQDDLPTAMDAEVYVDGKLEFKSKKKSKKEKDSLADKKRKEMKQKRDFAEICSVFRLLWATRQTEDIDKEKDNDRYTKITLRELAVYVVFVIILCVIAFGMISGLTYTFTNVLTDAFVNSPTSDTPPLTFATINQMADIWKILFGPFLDNLYSDWYDTNENNTQDLSKYVANENRVLGLARMRQVRVKSNSCVVPSDFSVEIKYCYSDWAASVEDQSPYGLYVSQNITNVTAWYYQSQSQLDGSSYQGLMNNYGGGGFILDLSQDKATSKALIQYLFDNLWIDRGTRAVFVDFTVYNANINLFGQIKLAFELPATGGVTPSYIVRAVKLIRYVSIFDYVILACEILFCLFIVYYLIEEAIEIKKHKLSYFKSVWNVLDVLILVLAIICVVFNVYRQIKVNQLLEGLLANDDQYFDFDFLCYWQSVFNGTLAFMVFLAWIKIFKYVSFNKTMTQLSMTLSRCAKDVIGFAIMFFIVFLAYAQLGFLIFGTQIYEYSTFSETIFSLFRLVLGDFDFSAMEQANRVLGPIFFLTYVFFVFFVLLNMFIAIINDTYGEIKMEISSQKSDIELASFFKRRYDKLMDKLNLKRTHIVDIHQAVKSSDINSDKKIDFIEWRNNLRNKGYGDVEIETLFAKYDLDGDRCLNEAEQMTMLKDLAEQNAEIKEAYKVINHAKEENKENEEFKKRKRGEGVTFEDYHLLSQRIDKMESSIGSITNKIDSVLNKLDNTKSERIHSGRKSNDSKWDADSRGSRTQLRNSNSAGTSDKNKQEQSNIGRQKETSSFSLLADRSINPVHGTQSDC